MWSTTAWCSVPWFPPTPGRSPPRGGDRPGDLLLAAHGVDRDHRPEDVYQSQQLGDRRDLVRLLVAGHLRQRQPILAGPDAHRVQRPQPLGSVVTAAQRLAVNRQRRPFDAGRRLGRVAQRPDPRGETRLERPGPRRHEHATEDVLPLDPMRHRQDRREEILLEDRPLRDRRRPRRPGEHRDQSDHHHQGMLAVDLGLRVLQLLEISHNLVQPESPRVRHRIPPCVASRSRMEVGLTESAPRRKPLKSAKSTHKHSLALGVAVKRANSLLSRCNLLVGRRRLR
jgi:hypothetical protein